MAFFNGRNSEDDDEDGASPNPPNAFVGRPASTEHHFYLSGPILGPEKYTPWFDFIRNASENDIIYIHINTPGGHLSTTIQFLRVLSETKALVVGSVEGYCMSAGTIIFLKCHAFQVSDHSMFMFHNYSGQALGKGGEMFEQVTFEKSWSKNFMLDVYKDFLTDAEIDSLLDNKDLWLTSDDVGHRLTNKLEKTKERMEKSFEDLEMDISTTPVKKAAKKPAKKAVKKTGVKKA